jgi:hypothetical protein
MSVAFRIDPEHLYDTGAVVLGLEIPSATIARARREGRLRYTRKGRRVLYLGGWLLDWLTDSQAAKEVQSCHD